MSGGFQAPKGTFDVLPDASAQRQRIADVARSIFERAGYGRIETPAFEETELFVRDVLWVRKAPLSELLTSKKGFVNAALYEHVPGGARWRYVWGSTLVFAFAVQMITGLFLWMHYSPSSQTAWESVYYIQHEMTGGWLLRGIHHYTAQVMIVLLALHMLQVIIDGAYRAPREINFWIGLVLLNLVLGLSFTGYLLPWDQKGTGRRRSPRR